MIFYVFGLIFLLLFGKKKYAFECDFSLFSVLLYDGAQEKTLKRAFGDG